MIPVDLAVNDDNGNTSDRAHAINFPGLDLSAIDTAGVHFRELRGYGFYLSRRKWPATLVRSHVGNIYWERYGFPSGWDAAAFLDYVRKTKLFTPEGGFDELYRWWESGITDHAHIRKLLIDAEKDWGK